MILISDIKKIELNKQDSFLCLDEFLIEINRLRLEKYFFRGLEKSSFLLRPSAFRDDKIQKREEIYSLKAENYEGWNKSDKYKNNVKLIRHSEGAVFQPDVIRISELTKYKLIYNYFLSKHVKNYPEKFDKRTREMHEIRKPDFWLMEETFHYVFYYELNSATTLTSLNNKVIKKGVVTEEIAGYDESLPQHYDTETAALDWSKNPLKALYFATKEPSTENFSLCAYKEIRDDETNPIVIEFGNSECINERIIAQEGLFTKFRYACIYYLFHGKWPCIEDYIAYRSAGRFKLIKFDIPQYHREKVISILEKNNITKKSLKLDEEYKIPITVE